MIKRQGSEGRDEALMKQNEREEEGRLEPQNKNLCTKVRKVDEDASDGENLYMRI